MKYLFKLHFLFTLIVLTTVILIPADNLSGQSFKYRRFNFEWKNKNPSPIAVEEQFKKEDAVILEEDNIYFVNQDYRTKHIRIKLQNERGVKKFSQFILPEGYDPAGDKKGLNRMLHDSIFRPKGEFECIEYFAARIIKPDGTIQAAKIQETTQEEVFRVNQIDRHFYNWIFTITNALPGDEIEVEYALIKAFNSEYSGKIFFNGVLPKQNYSMKFRNEAVDYWLLTYHNGAEPNDSSMNVKGFPNYTEFVFRRKNLIGGIDEPGARPHRELPYITYYFHDRTYGVKNPKSGFVDYPRPFPWTLKLLPYIEFEKDNINDYLSLKSESCLEINKFFKTQTALAGDSNPALIFNQIQHTINTEFDYQNDYNYFAGDDMKLERLGKFVAQKKLREISRDHLYRELFLRLKTNYYATKLFDKRYYSMDYSRYETESSFRWFYVLPSDQSYIYYYPKTGRFGLEPNELPFYFEDAKTMLIPQLVSKDERKNPFPDVRFELSKTPFSTSAENTRSSNVAAIISLETLKADFDARLRLSGQFSTLLRGYYLYNELDTTINPLYAKKLCELDFETIVQKSVLNSFNKSYPFKAELALTYSSQNIIKKKTDGEYEVALSPLFNHIIDDKFSAENRHLDYYPDFSSNDVYRYLVKFDREITLLNASELNEKITNPFATYTFTVKQNDSSSVLIESNYTLKVEYVPAMNAYDVEDVFNKIKKVKNISLLVKLK